MYNQYAIFVYRKSKIKKIKKHNFKTNKYVINLIESFNNDITIMSEKRYVNVYHRKERKGCPFII